MYALIDCNNFYASAERVFQPELRDKPLVVLSNNDGCAIARSQEAKDMGIKMGDAYFQLEHLVKEGKLQWRSSNYTLYQDMMRRVTAIVREMWPEIEIYSIDESFCDLHMFDRFNLELMAIDLRARIFQYTGIPVCVGIGPTRTLAKAANRTAKKHFKETGVYCINDEDRRQFALKNLAIDDVWGIGPRNAVKLLKIGINTAWDFATVNNYEWVQDRFTVTGLRTWYELNGKKTLQMEYIQPIKKGIGTGRSFNQKTDDYKTIEDALSTYVQNVAPKLRAQKSLCGRIEVYLHTSQFEVVHKLKSASHVIKIAAPTNLTQELLNYALKCLKRIYKPGYPYQKVGVMLFDLIPEGQVYLHEDPVKREKLLKISKLTDRLNQTWGKDTVRFAVMSFTQPFMMRQAFLSQRYTTRIDELLTIDSSKVFKHI